MHGPIIAVLQVTPFCSPECHHRLYHQHRGVCSSMLTKPLLPSQIALRIALEVRRAAGSRSKKCKHCFALRTASSAARQLCKVQRLLALQGSAALHKRCLLLPSS